MRVDCFEQLHQKRLMIWELYYLKTTSIFETSLFQRQCHIIRIELQHVV